MTHSLATRRVWTVTGMDCASCSTKITRALSRLPGVSDVHVALMAERLTLTLAPATTAPAEIEAAVTRLGFGITPAPSRPAAPQPEEAPPPCCGGHGCGTDPEPQPHQSACHDHDHNGHGHSGHRHDHEHGHDHTTPERPDQRWFQTGKGRLVLLTGALLGAAWGLERLTTSLTGSADIGRWAFTAACLIGLASVARRAWESLRSGNPFTIEGLMTIAALGALIIGAAEEAALVVFLFAVGELLEGVAAGKARNGIRALAALVPKTALLLVNGQPQEVPAASLRPGAAVLVRPGERIPADGTVATGVSGVDESPVTGESVPRTKAPGDPVFAGSINTEAALTVTVTKEASDTTLARIVRLVEEAEEARAPTERFIDRFSRWYMPVIVLAALLVTVLPPLLAQQPWDVWIYRGLSLLLIGCPCALVISVPASIASALSAGARRGLLMKGGAVIEAAAAVRHVAFDKTGTLTQGRPQVTDVLPADGTDTSTLLTVAAGIEAGSSHPLAQAILRRAADGGITLPRSEAARALPGRGVEATINGMAAAILSPHSAADRGLLPDAQRGQATTLEAAGKTVVAVSYGAKALGLIALRDEPRPDAADAVRQLQAMGITATMLTGDNSRTAAAIAAPLGIAVQAEMLPEDKLAAIRALAESGQDRKGPGGVMMIGDGINDAPALKQASVGVAMGSGTDVALETADAAILRDRVSDVPALIRLSRQTMRNIRQNVALALGLKAVFLVTSVLGITGLWIAILADTGATVLVTLNALRLLRTDPTRSP